MKVIDAGHIYEVKGYDGPSDQRIVFMKREGKGYPKNKGCHPGTNCQEILRVLIDRVEYLQSQIPDFRNPLILENLRAALFGFEDRAAQRHNRKFEVAELSRIEKMPTCETCGHIGCDGKKHHTPILVEES